MKIKILFLAICMSCFLCGCDTETVYEDNGAWNDNYKIKDITVYTAAENPENICIVSYPHNYISNGEWWSMEATALDTEDLSIEEARYFYEYISALQTPDYIQGVDFYKEGYQEAYEGHNFACAIELEYKNYWGEDVIVRRYCFDEYPNNWNEFVGRFNTLCGKEYLTNETTLQKMTSDYLQETMRFTEDTYSKEKLQQGIEVLNLDMFHFVVVKRGMISDYEIDEELTVQYLPREVQNEESTAKEFGHFVSAFIRDNFGKYAFDDLEVLYFENVAYCRVKIAGEYIYFFRTCRINKKDTVSRVWLDKTTYYNEEFEYYIWNSISGEYTWGEEFYYNADGKYGMVIDSTNHSDVINAFVHAK